MTTAETLSVEISDQLDIVELISTPIILDQITFPRQEDFKDRWVELGNNLPIPDNITFLWKSNGKFMAKYATFADGRTLTGIDPWSNRTWYVENNYIDKYNFRRGQYNEDAAYTSSIPYIVSQDRTKVAFDLGSGSMEVRDTVTNEILESFSVAGTDVDEFLLYENGVIYFSENPNDTLRKINDDGTGETQLVDLDTEYFGLETTKVNGSVNTVFHNPTNGYIYLYLDFDSIDTSEPASYTDPTQLVYLDTSDDSLNHIASSYLNDYDKSLYVDIDAEGLWYSNGVFDYSTFTFMEKSLPGSGFVHKITVTEHEKQDIELLYSYDVADGDSALTSLTVGEGLSAKKIQAGFDDITTVNFDAPVWPDTDPGSAGIPREGIGHATITTSDTSSDFSTIYFSVPKIKNYYFEVTFTCAVNVNLYVNGRQIASNIASGTYEGFIPRKYLAGEADNVQFDFEVVTTSNSVTFQSLELFDWTFDEYDNLKITGGSSRGSGGTYFLLQLNDDTGTNYHSQTFGSLCDTATPLSNGGFLEYTTLAGLHVDWIGNTNSSFELYLIDIHKNKKHGIIGQNHWNAGVTGTPSGAQRYQLLFGSVHNSTGRLKNLTFLADNSSSIATPAKVTVWGLRGGTNYGL